MSSSGSHMCVCPWWVWSVHGFSIRDRGVFYETNLLICGLWLSSYSYSIANDEWGQPRWVFTAACLRMWIGSLGQLGSFVYTRQATGRFPGSRAQESASNVGDTGSIPGSGRPLGGGNGNPLQYSCLESLTDRGAWWAVVRGIQLKWLHLYLHTHATGHEAWVPNFPYMTSFASAQDMFDSCAVFIVEKLTWVN